MENCKDSWQRTLIKTVFFKIATTGTTALMVGLSGAIKIHILMTIIYLVYERIWNRIKWGRKVINN